MSTCGVEGTVFNTVLHHELRRVGDQKPALSGNLVIFNDLILSFNKALLTTRCWLALGSPLRAHTLAGRQVHKQGPAVQLRSHHKGL